MKKIRLLSIAIASVLVATATWAADFNLNVSSSLTIDDPMFKGLQQFKEGVGKKFWWKDRCQLFPSSQLGSDEDVLEQARSGAGVAVLVDGGRLAPFLSRSSGFLGHRTSPPVSPRCASW